MAAMPLTESDVAHVATLARLGLSDEERSTLQHELEQILEHIGRLNAIETSHIAETAQVGGLINIWREDAVAESLSAEKALQNAPRREDDDSGGYFLVGAIQE